MLKSKSYFLIIPVLYFGLFSRYAKKEEAIYYTMNGYMYVFQNYFFSTIGKEEYIFCVLKKIIIAQAKLESF